MFQRTVPLLLCLVLVLNVVVDGQSNESRTSTITKTKFVKSVTTTTVTEPSKAVCATFVNASTACRRRRQVWIDVPIILALDGDMGDQMEMLLNPSKVLKLVPFIIYICVTTNLI